MMRRRLAAIAALVLAFLTVALAIVVTIQEFPDGLILLACLVVAVVGGWFGVVRRGVARAAGLGIAVLAIAGGVLVIVVGHQLWEELAIVAGVVLAVAATRAAFTVRASLPAAPAPQKPILFFNPKSGGGKAERFQVAVEARARGIEPVELRRDDDLESLVRDAVARGADGLAMAGGDGSQAIVAAIAAELGLPYACIPSGTRNHFALDLGVDRNDVVGALDAFVDGGERVVDLAEVNGRVFVNNVSLGLYAEAVQRPQYRDAKLRTLLDAAPDALGPDAVESSLVWHGPAGGEERSAALLVSNNRYRLDLVMGGGTRPRMDEGVLGIIMLAAPPGRESRGRRASSPLQQWTTAAFEVESDGEVPAGIDGEAAMLASPLRFRMRPDTLRVRIARHHPGASPSAGAPETLRAGLSALGRLAVGRE